MVVDPRLPAGDNRGMAPRKWTGRPPGRPKGSTGEPRVQITAYLRPDQHEALKERARRESLKRGRKRLDLSGVLRAIIDKALRLRPPKE